MKTLTLLLIMLNISACATHSNYAKVVDAWVGQDADNLIKQMGPPQGSYDLKSGGKVLYYISGAIDMSGCRTDFVVGADSVIEKWSARGNGCTATRADTAQPGEPKKTFLSTFGL